MSLYCDRHSSKSSVHNPMEPRPAITGLDRGSAFDSIVCRLTLIICLNLRVLLHTWVSNKLKIPREPNVFCKRSPFKSHSTVTDIKGCMWFLSIFFNDIWFCPSTISRDWYILCPSSKKPTKHEEPWQVVDDLHGAEDGEAGEESHGAADQTQLGVDGHLHIPLYLIICCSVDVDVDHL